MNVYFFIGILKLLVKKSKGKMFKKSGNFRKTPIKTVKRTKILVIII